jgi:hypothetical protein
MGYQKHNFKSGDVLTAEIMNEIEQGIVDASSSQTNLELTKTINNVKAVFAGLQQKNIFAVAEIENTAEKRQTADGATNGITVLDGSYATVKKIQGKTIASKNLFDISKVPTVGNITNNGDSLTLSAYNEEPVWFYNACPNVNVGDIIYLYFESSGAKFVYVGGQQWNVGSALTVTETIKNGSIRFYGISGGSCTISKIMITKTQNATYQPYFQGLKNAQISGIKSTGRNLLNLNRTKADFDGNSDKTAIRTFDENTYLKGFNENNYWNESNVVSVSIENNKVTINSNNLAYGVGFPIKCLPNTKYTISLNAETVYSKYYVSEFDSNGAYILNKWHSQQSTFTLTTHENCTYMVLVLAGETVNGQKGLVEFSNIMVCKGATALPYEAYTENVMSLSETVELGEWDYIENGKVVKQTETTVFDGAESWTLFGNNSDNTGTVFYSPIGGIENAIISGGFNKGTFNNLPSELKANSYVCGSFDLVFCTSTPNQTLNDWINYLSSNPLTAAYKGTATKTDIYADFEYQVVDKGQEQMQLENTDAIPTITADYYILGGTTE